MAEDEQRDFEVVLSFAGAERVYARAIHDICVANGLRVFLDEEFQHEMWGQSLVEYLDVTYRARARYCLMLVSAAYRERAYTRLERRAAFDRMLDQPNDYVLPVRIDDTQIPGLARSITHVDLRVAGVLGVCELLIQKLTGDKRTVIVPDGCRVPRVPMGRIPADHLKTYLTELTRGRSYVVFGVLVYDETTAELRKLLQDRDYWDALDKASGPSFEIFAVRDEEHEQAAPPNLEMLTAASLSRAVDRQRYFSTLVKRCFGEDARLVYPSLLLFVISNAAVLQSRVVPLARGTVEQTFQRLQALVTLIAGGVEDWEAGGAGIDELWGVLRDCLQAAEHTIYIQRGARDAPVAIADLARFIEPPAVAAAAS